MSRKFRALRISGPDILWEASALLLFILGLYVGLSAGIIIVDANVYWELVMAAGIAAAITAISIFTRARSGWAFVNGGLLIFYLWVIILSIPYFRITLFFIASFIIVLHSLYSVNSDQKGTARKSVAFAVILFAMLLIAGLIRLNIAQQNVGLLVLSITDDVKPGGVPLIFQAGMVVFSKYLVVTVSLQSLALFSLLSILLVENYFMIFSLIGETGGKSAVTSQVSGAMTVLSCQCESITAALPSVVSLLLSVSIIPMILESIALVGLTYGLLRYRFLRDSRSAVLDRIWPASRSGLFMGMSSVLVIGSPLALAIGAYLGLEGNLFFFGFENFIMLLAGTALAIITYGIIGRQRSLGKGTAALLLGITTLVMFMWFIPYVSAITVHSALLFSIMGMVSFAGGVLSGFVYSHVGPDGKKIFQEYLAMMFSMFAIVVFYVSVVMSYRIWPIFSITQQVEFSIALWVVSLPAMWLATNLVLNGYAGRGMHGKKPGVDAVLPQ